MGVDLKELNAFLPKKVPGFGHAYPFMCHMAMQSLGQKIARERPGEEIAYIFESGDEHQAEAHTFMSNVLHSPEMKEAYLYKSHAFVPKQDAPPLQAADFLAWEYARYWERTAFKKTIPMRKSLVALLSDGYTTMEFKKKYVINFSLGLRSGMQCSRRAV
jgi:tRNA nucleotidyltransferase/poly(A) polymerase